MNVRAVLILLILSLFTILSTQNSIKTSNYIFTEDLICGKNTCNNTSEFCCTDICCSKTGSCCNYNDSAHCCKSSTTCCGDICCSSGEWCLQNNECCNIDNICGDTSCCDTDETCLSTDDVNFCCKNTDVCGMNCCLDGYICLHENGCCQQEKVCGSSCCSFTEYCDKDTLTCSLQNSSHQSSTGESSTNWKNPLLDQALIFQILLAAFFIAVGCVEGVVGYRLQKTGIFIIGFFNGFLIGALLVTLISEVLSIHDDIQFVVIILGSQISGIVAGIVGIFYIKLVPVMIGISLGGITSMILTIFVLFLINTTIVLYVSFFVFIIVFAGLAFKFRRYLLIINSSVLGAYLVISGCGGDFIESFITNQIITLIFLHFSESDSDVLIFTIIWIVGVVILSIIFFVVQIKFTALNIYHTDDEDEDDDTIDKELLLEYNDEDDDDDNYGIEMYDKPINNFDDYYD